MFQQMRVLGIRRFNDSVEGKNYDFTKVRIEIPVPRNAENECGTNVVEAVYGKSSSYEELRAKFKFPCVCSLDVEMTSKGLDVLAIEPVEMPKVKAV